MSVILRTHQLHKQYGRLVAVDHLNLEIQQGAVFGLLGPNGSGKTTTLGMILDVILPTSGSYEWFGEQPTHEHRKRIGAILEKPNFYPNYSGYENLELICKIKESDRRNIAHNLDLVGLGQRGRDRFQTYSLGMKQRLAIAAALLNDPEVLILDEPTNGLDPQGIAEIRTLIQNISQTGKTIILASHLLDEVQKVCETFAVLRQGKLLYTGNVSEDFGDQLIIEVSGPDVQSILNTIQQHPTNRDAEINQGLIVSTWPHDTAPAAINTYLHHNQQQITHFVVKKKRLEDQFMEIIAQDDQAI